MENLKDSNPQRIQRIETPDNSKDFNTWRIWKIRFHGESKRLDPTENPKDSISRRIKKKFDPTENPKNSNPQRIPKIWFHGKSESESGTFDLKENPKDLHTQRIRKIRAPRESKRFDLMENPKDLNHRRIWKIWSHKQSEWTPGESKRFNPTENHKYSNSRIIWKIRFPGESEQSEPNPDSRLRNLIFKCREKDYWIMIIYWWRNLQLFPNYYTFIDISYVSCLENPPHHSPDF